MHDQDINNRQVRRINFPYDGTSRQALGPNPSRLALLLCPSGTQSYSFAFGEAATSLADMSLYPFNNPPLLLTREVFGDIIALPLNIIGTGADTAAIWEIYGP